MTDDGVITNRMLLEHMQAGFNRVDRQFAKIDERFEGIDQRFERLEKRIEEGFEEARRDRQGIRDDLDATIRMQFKQQKQLAVIGAGPMPEEF